jgi:hypothetical protein
MARVRSITEAAASQAIHPTEVDAEIRQVIASNGDVLLQLSTFGSDHRASLPKVSQTLQFDRATAINLRDLIDRYLAST